MGIEMRMGYKADNASFGAFMLSRLPQRWALQGAYAVAEKAKALTPRGQGPAHMADLYIVHPIPALVVGRNARAAAQVTNLSPHAAAVEFGNRKSRRRRPLGRAGATVGEFRDARKE